MSVTRKTDRTPRRARKDDGIVIVFMALLLVVLLIFSAFAIDLGALYNARRQDQNAADAGTLSAAQDLGNAANIYNQVDLRVSETLDVSPGTLNWNSCTLADNDFVDTPISVSGASYNCITTNSGATQLQVKLPTREVGSLFGGIVGTSSYSHSAFAIAGLRSAGFGGVLPFGLPASAAGNNIECLKDGPGGHSEAPCDGPDTGNFGYLDLTFYGSDEVATPQTCTGHENDRIANNIAVGVDHDLSIYTGTEVIEGTECGGAERAANTINGNTGNRASAFGSGIYSGTVFTDGKPGRLQRHVSELSWGVNETIGGFSLDDNPLWEFIDPIDENQNGTVEVPPACLKSVFTDAVGGVFTQLPTAPANVRAYVSSLPTREAQLRALLDRCFTHYKGDAYSANGAIAGGGEASPCPVSDCADPVFGRNSSTSDSPDLYDIQYTPRFGYVPQLATDFGSGSSTSYHIAAFRAVFLQRLLGSCKGNGSCDLDFEPFWSRSAAQSSGASNGKAEAITAFIFPATMLPNGLSSAGAPFDIGKNRFITLIR